MNDTTDDVLEREPDGAPAPMLQFDDGIYFDLPENMYHGQHRLSSSGIQAMMASEADFWAGSWMNPDRKDADTLARQLGRAYHIARLEPHRFHTLYCRELTPEDRPGALDSEGVKDAIKAIIPQKESYGPALLTTDTDVKAALAAMGQPKAIAGESAYYRAQRLLSANPEAVVWSVVKAEWESEFGPMTAPANEGRFERAVRLRSYGFQGQIWDWEYAAWRALMGEREALPPVYFDQILRDMALIEGNEDVAKHLTGGQSEVSVFWTDESGVRMKARIDDLHEWGCNDFKTFDNPYRKPLRKALSDAFRFNRYYIQAAVYREAMEAIRLGNLNIGGAYTQKQASLIGNIRARALPMGMRYTFQQKGGVPNLVSLDLEFYAGLDPSLRAAAAGADPARVAEVREKYSNANASAWWRRAKIEIRAAVQRFQVCMEVFGEDRPWSTINSDGTLGDDDFNSFFLDMKD